MTSYVDELESQRRELEARRALLEERFKLRLATAQEFGLIHTHRLDRVREAFVAQCSAARRRNEGFLEKIRQSNDTFTKEKALSWVSRKRLSHQTERFLSVAEKLYPDWQEQQLHQKASQLRAIEEERFVTEQRRLAARNRFEQEQALAAVISECRRRLASARAQERNEMALRQLQRDRSVAEDAEAIKAERERVDKDGRKVRYGVLEKATKSRHRHRRRSQRDGRKHRGNPNSSSSRNSGDEHSDRDKRYLYIGGSGNHDDDFENHNDDDYEGKDVKFGTLGGSQGTIRNGSINSTAGSNAVGVCGTGRSSDPPRDVEKRLVEEQATVPQKRPQDGEQGSDIIHPHSLEDVFCATRGQIARAAEGRGDAGTGQSDGRGRATTRIQDTRDETKSGDGSASVLSPIAARNSSGNESAATAPIEVGPDSSGDAQKIAAEKPRKAVAKKPQRTAVGHHGSDQSDDNVEVSQQPPRSRRVDGHRVQAIERKSADSNRGTSAVSRPSQLAPNITGGLLSPLPGRIRSFSGSSEGSGEVLPSSPAQAPSLVVGGAMSAGRIKGTNDAGHEAEAREQETASRDAKQEALAASRKRVVASATSSWSELDEDDNKDDNGDGDGSDKKDAEKDSTRVKATAGSILEPAGFGEGTLLVGEGGQIKEKRVSSESLRKEETPQDEKHGPPLSLPAAAKAVSVLTARVEGLAAEESAAAAAATGSARCGGRELSVPSVLILEAYGSAAATRSAHRGTCEWGAETAAVAEAAASCSAEDAHLCLSSDLERFGMVALCRAVLDLVAAYATDLLPPTALTGLVTVEKIHTHHRRSSNAHPGRIQLSNALTGHARRLCSTAEPGGLNGENGGGAVEPAAVAAVFAECFETVFAAQAQGHGGDARGSERLRRKVLSYLESAADSSGIPSISIQLSPSAEASTGGSSSGVVLGGGRSGSSKKKKGGGINLSSMVGSMADFSIIERGGGLPEFEDYEALEDAG